MMTDHPQPLLAIKDLSVSFRSDGESSRVRHDISLTINPGETVALAGESGSGKSVTALSILQLLDRDSSEITGKINFDGHNLLNLNEPAMQQIRGNRIAMIFQEPMTSLNPVLTIERQITETLEEHLDVNREAARARALEMLNLVGISEPERRLKQYPHQLSGGMRQRVMIA
ncbi:MAG: ABC transporter ATP-binding protein, partial [Desulfobulbaceae bacterium]|nr:ABC transporter ATP-binding protein [Desulfobulbaceae bacterium]